MQTKIYYKVQFFTSNYIQGNFPLPQNWFIHLVKIKIFLFEYIVSQLESPSFIISHNLIQFN